MIKSYQHADNFQEQEYIRCKVLRNEEWEARRSTGKTKSKDGGGSLSGVSGAGMPVLYRFFHYTRFTGSMWKKYDRMVYVRNEVSLVVYWVQEALKEQ